MLLLPLIYTGLAITYLEAAVSAFVRHDRHGACRNIVAATLYTSVAVLLYNGLVGEIPVV